MRDEQLIRVSINCLCLRIWLHGTHVRGTFFFCSLGVTSEERGIFPHLLFFPSSYLSGQSASHNVASLCLGTRKTGRLETDSGLPMWKRFPRALAAASMLISRSEPGLEKLSSGRQAAGWDGGKAHRGSHATSVPLQSKAEKRHRVTQDGKVRLQPRDWLTEPGTVSSCDGANSSFGKEIKIRKVQCRVKWAVGNWLPKPCSSLDPLHPKVCKWCKTHKTTQRNTCATVPHSGLVLPSDCTGLRSCKGSGFRENTCSSQTVSIWIIKVRKFPETLWQRMGVLCAASRPGSDRL